jgi:hypothetical protein
LVIEVHSAKPVLVNVVERPVSMFVAALMERTKIRGVSRDVRLVDWVCVCVRGWVGDERGGEG